MPRHAAAITRRCRRHLLPITDLFRLIITIFSRYAIASLMLLAFAAC